MKPGIKLEQKRFDEDVTEFKVTVADGSSEFSTDVYVSCDYLAKLIGDLCVFRDQIYGGLYDIEMGSFGPEYANGAFHARLHFYVAGKIGISTSQQTEFFEFANREVSAESKMYLRTEPVLLDNFITQLKLIKSGTSEEAELACA